MIPRCRGVLTFEQLFSAIQVTFAPIIDEYQANEFGDSATNPLAIRGRWFSQEELFQPNDHILFVTVDDRWVDKSSSPKRNFSAFVDVAHGTNN